MRKSNKLSVDLKELIMELNKSGESLGAISKPSRKKPSPQTERLRACFLLITWTKIKPSWGQTLWSGEAKKELFGHNKEQSVWRREVRPFTSRTTHLLSSMVVVLLCCEAVFFLPVDLLLQRKYMEQWSRRISPTKSGDPELIRLGALGCSKGTMIPNTHQKW